MARRPRALGAPGPASPGKEPVSWLGDPPLGVSVQPLEMGGGCVNTCDKGQGSLTYKERLGANIKRAVSSGSFTARKTKWLNGKSSSVTRKGATGGTGPPCSGSHPACGGDSIKATLQAHRPPCQRPTPRLLDGRLQPRNGPSESLALWGARITRPMWRRMETPARSLPGSDLGTLPHWSRAATSGQL